MLSQLCSALLKRPIGVVCYSLFIQSVEAASSSSPTPFSPERISRKVIYRPENDQKLSILLYQYQSCPFCCKTRAFLDFKGINYSVIEVNSVTKKQLQWSEDYKKVPLVLVEDKDTKEQAVLQDSSQIISILASKSNNPEKPLKEISKMYPVVEKIEKNKKIFEFPSKYNVMMKFIDNKKTQNDLLKSNESYIREERQWRRWLDEKFVHIISPNIYPTLREAIHTFRTFSEAGNWDKEFSFFEREFIIYFGALIMRLVKIKLIKQHGYSENNIRSHLYKLINEWCENIKEKGGKFNGGDLPDLADISMFGILTSFEKTKAFNDLKENTPIMDWFNLMKNEKKVPISS